MIDMTNESSAGPSATDRALYAHLTNHIATERGLLEEYSDIADRTESRAFRYLVNLLIEDEIRHHRIFSELAESVEAIALMKTTEPVVPFDRLCPSLIGTQFSRRRSASSNTRARTLANSSASNVSFATQRTIR